MADFLVNSAVPSEGSMRTSWPALRNGYCANHSEYQRDHGCRYDSRSDYHAMFNILSGSGL